MEVKAGQDTRACAGPGCQQALKGQQARFCSERCRKAAHRDRQRATRPAPARSRGAAQAAQRQAEADEYARDLAAEAASSLRRDPERWKWRRSNETPDRRHLKGRRAEP